MATECFRLFFKDLSILRGAQGSSPTSQSEAWGAQCPSPMAKSRSVLYIPIR